MQAKEAECAGSQGRVITFKEQKRVQEAEQEGMPGEYIDTWKCGFDSV